MKREERTASDAEMNAIEKMNQRKGGICTQPRIKEAYTRKTKQ